MIDWKIFNYLLEYKKFKSETLVKLTCPICGKKFYFPKRNLSTHPNPCCSKQCGYKKGVLTRKLVK